MTIRRQITLLATLSALLLTACVDTQADDGYCATCKPDTGTRMDSQVGAGEGGSRIDGAAPDSMVSVLDGSSTDGSITDGAADSGMSLDSGADTSVPGPCGGACKGSKPVCHEATNTCVQCTASNDDACKGDDPVCDTETNTCVPCTATDPGACTTDAPVCKASVHQCVECTAGDKSACDGDTPLCDVPNNDCVACLEKADCQDPNKSRCNAAKDCVPCSDDKHCTHLLDTPVCDESKGKCVECTGDTEATRCAGTSCKRSTGECTDTDTNSVGACGACEADSECSSGRKCIEQVFGTGPSAVSVGTFCFRPKPVDGCASITNDDLRPYSKEVTSTSIDTTTEAAYCLPVTTCQAYLDASKDTACSGIDPCGVMGLDDGVCNGGGKCTYPCGQAADCPGNVLTSCNIFCQ